MTDKIESSNNPTDQTDPTDPTDQTDPQEQTSNSETTEKKQDQTIEDVDAEIESMKKKVQEMEEETKKIKVIQAELEKELSTVGESKESVDARSIYVGNVDYNATPEELQNHFQGCGTINRVTILCDKYTGHPKGFAYIEFLEKDSIENALKLDGSTFRDRQIKVC